MQCKICYFDRWEHTGWCPNAPPDNWYGSPNKRKPKKSAKPTEEQSK